ncbi:BTAD domain-containing putative transcriptional regulator [Mycolicibacterium pyrenivorans]|uniref:BTAD domain-containing putative transcriptional regulator n=1 Tax=Mycolicibacterium pyrenivorans TaxID=187102 RepID=UPI0021F3ABE3|nr:BTAD domain-containing putative transcriptional regulator [Mycolicibacterium pyrenivorans]MCV7154758.1 AfsR/SARP family transcriptional regulator [Mycolicibacterium pyrenivorans]
MSVEFRLLGDVEARSRGQRLDIGHARQRCVLVALLVDVNRPVPADMLIDRVWADEPPHRARNALASYVSRLRQVVEDDGDVQIVRQSGGYVLTADPMTVDLHCFRRLAAKARATVDPAAAAQLFDEALELWHREAFVSLDTPWVNEVRTSLSVEHLSVQLDRNDVLLQVGRHAELLGRLAEAVKVNPLDERLAGQLMLAQYRSGRQADALDIYRTMRERLVEELGVDPGPSLRAVHRRILDGDPTQAVAPARPSARVVTRVRENLPRRATRLIGRDDDVVRVAAVVDDGPLVTLTGVGGVGKTRLALEVADHIRDRLEDGAWFCELAPVEDASAVTHAVAATLRLQQQQGLGIEATVIEYLRSRELLLVIDNCEHVLDTAARLLDQIVRYCPRASVLATSREALGVEGERILQVPPLTAEDAVALFADRARAGRPGFDIDHEPVGAVAEICRRLDGLPLAIELAAARMRVTSSLDIARRLDKLRLLSGGARGVAPRQQSLAATIEWSYRLLAQSEQSLFMRLSVFAGDFDLEAAHGVCAENGASEDDTLELLAGLVDKSMVTVRGDSHRTRYGVLETLRAFGRDRLRDNGVDDHYGMRHAVYFTELAQRAAAGMHSADERAWVERLLPDCDNLRAAFERAMADRDIDLALGLVTSLSELVHLRVGYESAGWAERVIVDADPDHPLFASAVGVCARGAWNRGEFSRATSLAALARGRIPGRGAGRVAYPADVLADVALYEGDPVAALAHYQGAVDAARSDADPIRLVWALFYVAICQAALRTPEAGVPAAEESMAVAEATENPTARSMARYALGLVLKKSDPDRALALFDEAAELAAGVQNFWWHGIALMEGAATRAVHGDPAIAAPALVEVLDHWDRVGDWSQQWLNLRYVTRFLFRVGAVEDAAALHRALLAAGRSSPLAAGDVPAEAASEALSGAAAVARARSALNRYG